MRLDPGRRRLPSLFAAFFLTAAFSPTHAETDPDQQPDCTSASQANENGPARPECAKPGVAGFPARAGSDAPSPPHPIDDAAAATMGEALGAGFSPAAKFDGAARSRADSVFVPSSDESAAGKIATVKTSRAESAGLSAYLDHRPAAGGRVDVPAPAAASPVGMSNGSVADRLAFLTGKIKEWTGAIAAAAPVEAADKGSGITRAIGIDPVNPLLHEHGEPFVGINLDAPKGGKVAMATIKPFYTYNVLDWRNTPPNLVPLVFQTLMTGTGENSSGTYGLVAESIEYPRDISWVDFHLRPEARFSDGTSVTPDDIGFSYETKRRSDPFYEQAFKAVPKENAWTVRDARTIRFRLAAENERAAKEAIQALGAVYVLSRRFYTEHPLKELGMNVLPIGTGPYDVESGQSGKQVVYRRKKDYWGESLPILKGHDNFDTYRFDYYRDKTVELEAAKSGTIDMAWVSNAAQWDSLIADKSDHAYRATEVPYDMPPGFDGLAMNTRLPAFQDQRVRSAMAIAMDFTWINHNLFHDSLQPTRSYFQRTRFARTSEVSEAERRLLDEYKERIPAAAYAEDPLPEPADAADSFNRKNLLKASKLLDEAGWRVNPRSLTRENARGEPLTFTVVYSDPEQEKWLLRYASDVRRLGVDIRLRLVDSSQSVLRIDTGDYGMTPAAPSASDAPRAERLTSLFGCAGSAVARSNANYARICDPAVDGLIQKVRTARSGDELKAATSALDRVLTASSYIVPTGSIAQDRLITNKKICYGKPTPYYGMNFNTMWECRPGEKPWSPDQDKAPSRR